jgi:hypothetical protein
MVQIRDKMSLTRNFGGIFAFGTGPHFINFFKNNFGAGGLKIRKHPDVQGASRVNLKKGQKNT